MRINIWLLFDSYWKISLVVVVITRDIFQYQIKSSVYSPIMFKIQKSNIVKESQQMTMIKKSQHRNENQLISEEN